MILRDNQDQEVKSQESGFKKKKDAGSKAMTKRLSQKIKFIQPLLLILGS